MMGWVIYIRWVTGFGDALSWVELGWLWSEWDLECVGVVIMIWKFMCDFDSMANWFRFICLLESHSLVDPMLLYNCWLSILGCLVCDARGIIRGRLNIIRLDLPVLLPCIWVFHEYFLYLCCLWAYWTILLTHWLSSHGFFRILRSDMVSFKYHFPNYLLWLILDLIFVKVHIHFICLVSWSFGSVCVELMGWVLLHMLGWMMHTQCRSTLGTWIIIRVSYLIRKYQHIICLLDWFIILTALFPWSMIALFVRMEFELLGRVSTHLHSYHMDFTSLIHEDLTVLTIWSTSNSVVPNFILIIYSIMLNKTWMEFILIKLQCDRLWDIIRVPTCWRWDISMSFQLFILRTISSEVWCEVFIWRIGWRTSTHDLLGGFFYHHILVLLGIILTRRVWDRVLWMVNLLPTHEPLTSVRFLPISHQFTQVSGLRFDSLMSLFGRSIWVWIMSSWDDSHRMGSLWVRTLNSILSGCRCSTILIHAFCWVIIVVSGA